MRFAFIRRTLNELYNLFDQSSHTQKARIGLSFATRTKNAIFLTNHRHTPSRIIITIYIYILTFFVSARRLQKRDFTLRRYGSTSRLITYIRAIHYARYLWKSCIVRYLRIHHKIIYHIFGYSISHSNEKSRPPPKKIFKMRFPNVVQFIDIDIHR
jgi:hypothetical protein